MALCIEQHGDSMFDGKIDDYPTMLGEKTEVYPAMLDRSSDSMMGINHKIGGAIISLPSFTNMAESSNLDRRVTSSQVPYEITIIANFDMNSAIGRLCVGVAPGKKDSKWNRDLIADLQTIRGNGIQIIVCLLEWSEMKLLNITDYPRLAQENGFLFYHVPIRDRGVPHPDEINILIPLIVNHLAIGRSILIHCRSGLGRAGTISACCLCHFGFTGKNAIEMVRKMRPGAVQTSKQMSCVAQYCRSLTSGI